MVLVIKRSADAFFATVSLVVFAPFLVILALLVKLTSSGPIIFKQTRIGKSGAKFVMYKFRTLLTDAPQTPKQYFGNLTDFYTPIGSFLRKFSLDELPQIINIIRGEMSFVGPRPAMTAEIILIEKRKENGSLNLVPGLTGWAQINGRALNDENTIAYHDGAYLNNFSLWFDFIIVSQTFFKTIISKDVALATKNRSRLPDNKTPHYS